MKKRIQSLDEFINESLNEKVLNEGEELEPGTKVLFIPFSARKNVLTPGEIVEKHKKGNDWYVIRNNKGDIEEVLRAGIKAIPGKTFEIVIYEGKIDEFKMSLDNYKKMVRKLVNKETFEDELFYENMISSFTEGKSPVECVKIWKKTIREDVNEEYEHHIKVLHKDFGGYSDSDFLKIVWYMEIPEIEELLQTTKEDLKWLNKRSKGLLGSFNRKDAQWLKSRIGFMKGVIKSKKKDPDYVPSHYKRKFK